MVYSHWGRGTKEVHSALHLKDGRTLGSSDSDNSDLAKNLENFLSCFFLSPFQVFISPQFLLPPWRWAGKESDENVRICAVCVCRTGVCVCVCVCVVETEREGGRDRGRDEICDLICSPGASLSRAAVYCRQSSPWRHLKTGMDGKLRCISNMAVTHLERLWMEASQPVSGLITVSRRVKTWATCSRLLCYLLFAGTSFLLQLRAALKESSPQMNAVISTHLHTKQMWASPKHLM